MKGGDITAQFAAFFDYQLAVTDFAVDAAGGANDELLARSQFTVEATMDFGDVDPHGAKESAVLGNLNDTAVHRCLDPAFDDQRVAVGDFGALEFDVGTDDQAATARFFGTTGFCLGCIGCMYSFPH